MYVLLLLVCFWFIACGITVANDPMYRQRGCCHRVSAECLCWCVLYSFHSHSFVVVVDVVVVGVVIVAIVLMDFQLLMSTHKVTDVYIVLIGIADVGFEVEKLGH